MTRSWPVGEMRTLRIMMWSERLTKALMCLVSQPSLSVLYMLSDGATHEAVHLLCRMLVFDPVSSGAAHC